MPANALTFSNAVDNELHLTVTPPHPPIADGEVLLKTLAAPINPIDLLVLTGRYPVKPKSKVEDRLVPGYDGVFEVLASAAPMLHVGDFVIPREHGFGTWRTHRVAKAAEVLKIHKLDPRAGAILKMGALVAHLLLEDVIKLQPGDWIIQNGATSVIAQLVVQYARLRQIKTASVIRDRPNFAQVKSRLEGLGADIVVSESQLKSGDPVLEGKKFVLGLDCIFGDSGENLAKVLAANGTYANFDLLSGMSSKLTISADMIFYKGLTFRSFRLSKCLASRTEQEVDELLANLADLFASNTVQVPELDVVTWNQEGEHSASERKLRGAVDRARERPVGANKVIFLFS